MKKPDSQVAYNLQLSLGWLPCNVHGDRSDSPSSYIAGRVGLTVLWDSSQQFPLSLQDSIPLVPIILPISSLSFLNFLLLLLVLWLVHVFFLAGWLPSHSLHNPPTGLCWALTPSCSTWNYPVANVAPKSAGCRLDGLHTHNSTVCCTSALIYQVHSPSSTINTTSPPPHLSLDPFFFLSFLLSLSSLSLMTSTQTQSHAALGTKVGRPSPIKPIWVQSVWVARGLGAIVFQTCSSG